LKEKRNSISSVSRKTSRWRNFERARGGEREDATDRGTNEKERKQRDSGKRGRKKGKSISSIGEKKKSSEEIMREIGRLPRGKKEDENNELYLRKGEKLPGKIFGRGKEKIDREKTRIEYHIFDGGGQRASSRPGRAPDQKEKGEDKPTHCKKGSDTSCGEKRTGDEGRMPVN